MVPKKQVIQLTDRQRTEALIGLPNWQLTPHRNAMNRRFSFHDFNEAWSFMTAIALYAEAHRHHPEWHNVYNRVDITLTTHDVNGLSEKDIRLARFIDHLHQSRFATP